VFWEDGKPPARNSSLPAPGVPDTAAGVLAWLQGNKGFVVSKPVSGMIGKLPATVVDIIPQLSEPNEVSFMTWSDFPDGPLYAFGAPRVIRLYLANIIYGGTQHLLMALVTAPNRARLQTWLPVAIPIIASATAPVSPG